MPIDQSIKTVLIVGSGPIVIGQACEFDYSGTQACRAIREEGCTVILVNSNPASIMTDQEVADHVYIEPIHIKVIESIIKKHRPDAILPTMGGQTALNITLELNRAGILEKYRVRLIGMQTSTIEATEDREIFKQKVESVGLSTPHSVVVSGWDSAKMVAKEIGFPIVVRAFFTLGGQGGGIAYDEATLREICEKAFKDKKRLLLEESIIGWKEYELELMCDQKGNHLVICGIENLDPMGVHTGDSITVAPIQTLTDKEYQKMRLAAFSLMKAVGMTSGGCNIQFAVHPENGKMHCIEMNPRVSRSSALASKATGIPIAKIAAKTALGLCFHELKNPLISDQNIPLFEPSIDYVVTKIPKFNFDKFPDADQTLSTHMKAIGEVMAIGRSFLESFQKAVNSLDVRCNRFFFPNKDRLLILNQLVIPSEERIFWILDAFRLGITVEEVSQATGFDPWFLYELEELVSKEKEIASTALENLDSDTLFSWKKMGFSDPHIAFLMRSEEKFIRQLRWKSNVLPVYKRVDTCAGEFPTTTTYLYSTYADECEAKVTQSEKIVILGSGPNQIGQGIEFDYCCVHAAQATRDLGYESIMINCNPETVSTDYDISDRLYLEPLTVEHTLEILMKENPKGVIVQMGGQTSLNLTKDINENGFSILGTSLRSIERAENRKYFSEFLRKQGIKQPFNTSFSDYESGMKKSEMIGFPLIVRPSYVIGGQSIEVISSRKELRKYLNSTDISKVGPILMEKHMGSVIEVEVDAISDGKEIFCCGIITHLDPLGIHSGDSASLLFSYEISQEIKNRIVDIASLVGNRLQIKGLFNLQLAIDGEEILIIEINPRASRTIPLLSKVTKLPLIQIAMKCILGTSLLAQGFTGLADPKIYALKIPVFPFSRLNIENQSLGVQMKSTGEVLCVGKTIEELVQKAMLYVDEKIDINISSINKLNHNFKDSDLVECYSFNNL